MVDRKLARFGTTGSHAKTAGIQERELKIGVGHEPPSKRLRIWKSLLHDNFMGVECRVAADDLRGAVQGRCIAASSVSRSSISRQVLTRTPSLIKREAAETVVVALVTDGSFAIEQGREARLLGRGDLCVLDGSRPFEAQLASDVVKHAILHVPKRSITRRIGEMGDTAVGPFQAGQPLQRLVAAFLQGMVASLDEVDAPTLDRLIDQSLDLLALMIGRNRGGSVAPSTHRAAMRLRIKAYIKSHLRDSDLTIDKAAAAIGMSSRYVNALLAEEGTSFGRFLLAERLEGARREILDPTKINRQVTEVAFDWGFNNTSHFGRTYKDRFGMTPRDAKHAGGYT